MNRETFTRLVRKELSGLRRFLMAACSGNGDEADDIAPPCWKHIIRIKDHKEELIPGSHEKPNKDGWID